MDQGPVVAEKTATGTVALEKGKEVHKGQGGDLETLWRVFVYLVMLGVLGAFFVYYFKRGKFSIGGAGKSNKLKIAETRALGGKQFLVVVEYEDHKILVGVGPGMMQKICDLEKKKETQQSTDSET